MPLRLYAHVTGQPVLRGATVRSTAAIFGNRVVGDLALIDHPVLGHVTARHTGHNLNHALVAALLADAAAWERV